MSNPEIIINKINKRIEKSELEKKLIHSRLTALNRALKPDLNTRKQTELNDQIKSLKDRLNRIEHELKKDRYHLNRVNGENIRGFEKTLLEAKERRKLQKRNLEKLEEFINETMYRTPQPENKRAKTSPEKESQENAASNIPPESQKEVENLGAIPKSTKFLDLNKPDLQEESNSNKKIENIWNFENQDDRLKDKRDNDNLWEQKARERIKEIKNRESHNLFSNKSYEFPNELENEINKIKQQRYSFNDLNFPKSNYDFLNESIPISEKFSNYKDTPSRMKSGYSSKIQNNETNPIEQKTFRDQSFDHNSNIGYNDNQYQYNYPQVNFRQQTTRARESFLRRLRLIPKFSGDSYQELKDFIDITDSLYNSCKNQFEEDEFYEQLTLQLRGEARYITTKIENYNWTNIKNALTKEFSHLSNKNLLTSQIENMRQDKDESLAKYAERARKLYKEKNATYIHLNDDQKKEHDRIARKAFIKGIKSDQLRNTMKIRGASSLEDAITNVLEIEYDNLNLIPKSDLYCKSCRSIGHREPECRRKNDNSDNLNKLIYALSNFGRNNLNNYGSSPLIRNRIYPNSANNSPNWNRNQNWNQNFNQNMNPNRNFNQNPNLNQNNNWAQNPNNNWNRNPNNNPNQNSYQNNQQQNRQNQMNLKQNNPRANNYIRNKPINTVQTEEQFEQEPDYDDQEYHEQEFIDEDYIVEEYSDLDQDDQENNEYFSEN